jgi:hypothetical protein
MSHPDDELRRALHDAVSDVQPHDALDQIRSRTNKVVPMNRRWLFPTIAAAAATAAVITGVVAVTNRNAGDDAPPVTNPTTTDTTSPSTVPDGTAPGAVPVYYVGDTPHGPRLYREFQRQTICQSTDCKLKAAVVSAVNGQPQDPDYRSLWPAGATVGNVSHADDVIVIDLASGIHDLPTGMSAKAAELAVQQVVYSAQAAVGAGQLPVQLLIDGKHTDQVLGVPASEPLAEANADDVLAPVQIDTPGNGAAIPAGDAGGMVEVSGRAATFEANVVWELMQGSTVVRHGFTTAQECCTLSPFAFTVKNVEPGTYTLVVHDSDESGEGRPVNQDTKEITVQ